VSESGAILLRRRGAADWTEMPRADAAALAALVGKGAA
jgi:hypothetical protein